jgi:hypothetical protein
VIDVKPERLLELLAYAKVCFEKCTNPFETAHLAKMNVTADECRDLSAEIASIIEDAVVDFAVGECLNASVAFELAEKRFAETQP